MSGIVFTVVRNIAAQLLSKTFGLWLAKLAAKSTTTMVDDNLVALLEGGLNNNPEQIEQAAKDILAELSLVYQKHT